MNLTTILEKLNNDKFFKKHYDAVIEVFYTKNKIKITRKNTSINIDDTNPIVYNPDPFIITNYNNNSYSNYCFYLTIMENWFSTEILISIHILKTNNINFDKSIFKTYRSYNINIYDIYDYIYCAEARFNEVNLKNIIASNDYICKNCKCKIYDY